MARPPIAYVSASDSPWLLFCCDADEIPRRETVSALRGHYDALSEPHHLEMALFYYSSEWIKRNCWYNAYVVNDQGLGGRRCRCVATRRLFLQRGDRGAAQSVQEARRQVRGVDEVRRQLGEDER